jgi:hypothetical protein
VPWNKERLQLMCGDDAAPPMEWKPPLDR